MSRAARAAGAARAARTGRSSVRDGHQVLNRTDARGRPGGVDRLVVLGPRAHRAVDGHGAVVTRDVEIVRVERSIPLERLLDRVLGVAGTRRVRELDLVVDVERTDDVGRDEVRLVTLVLPVGCAGERDEA